MKTAIIIPNYNHASSAIRCISALIGLEIGHERGLEIIVVDDGSTDGSADIIYGLFKDRIHLIRMPHNLGRSTARNSGARESDADYVIFVDSDCIAADGNFAAAYLEVIRGGADLIFGQVSTNEDGFWNQLQKSTFRNREAEFKSGQYWAYTTQNVCIRRDLFLKCGGFDLAFDKHGFEDRDLFIRLIEMGAKPAYCAAANVTHDDRISLRSVSGKMLAAGRHSSIPFGRKHPRHYALSPYAKLDCRIHPGLKWLDLLTWPIVKRLGGSDAAWLESGKIPLSARIAAARLIYGLHYLHGTALAASDRRNA
ncbi:MAG: glycosyltransferase family 2 protein [Arenimonas sp.]